jgi:NAD(P)-dependent dehydrogenase (short-subunit alcohol dehydrogenase family)
MASPPRRGLKTRLAAVWPVGELTGWPGASGFGSRSTAEEVLCGVNLRGRVFIVTGGSAGLGKATARALACAGARVVIACRDPTRGDAVASELTTAAAAADATRGGGLVTCVLCDLASLASTRAFAQAFTSTGLELHGLICNGKLRARAARPSGCLQCVVTLTRHVTSHRCAAGVMPAPFSLTADGHELQWQSNYLSHVLLTDLLLPLLERSAKGTWVRARMQARIRVLSCLGRMRAALCSSRPKPRRHGV